MTPVDGEMNTNGESLNQLINKAHDDDELAAKTAGVTSGKSSPKSKIDIINRKSSPPPMS